MSEIQAGGAVQPTALYIARPEDDRVFELLKQGEYCNVLTARQMGKTSLLFRLCRRLTQQGFRVADLDLSTLYPGSGEDAEQREREWYINVLGMLILRIKPRSSRPVEFDAAAWWNSHNEPTGTRLVRFFDEILLANDARMIVFLDEVDSTLSVPFSDELFIAIRQLYNARAENERYNRLSFCLMGVLTPDDLIKDRSRTPYNVGRTIHLSDFSIERGDVQPLVELFDRADLAGKSIVADIVHWTHGHPFLTMALAARVYETNRTDVTAIVDDQLSSTGEPLFDTHFERIEELLSTHLRQAGTALRLYNDVLSGKPIRDVKSRDVEVLKLAGIVRRDHDGDLVVGNPLYARRFGPKWLKQILPPRIPRWVFSVGAVLLALALAFAAALFYRIDRDNKELLIRRVELSRLEAVRAKLPRLAGNAFIDELRTVAPKDRTPLYEEYWRERAMQLEKTAAALEDAGCYDEALVVYAYAADRGATKPARLTWLAGRLSPVARTIWTQAPRTPIEHTASCASRYASSCQPLKATPRGEVVTTCGAETVLFTAAGGLRRLDVPKLSAFDLSPDGRWLFGVSAGGELHWRQLNEPVDQRENKYPIAANVCPPGVPIVAVSVVPNQGGFVLGVGCEQGRLRAWSLSGDWQEHLREILGGQSGFRANVYEPVNHAAVIGLKEFLVATKQGLVRQGPGPSIGLGLREEATTFAQDMSGSTIAVAYQGDKTKGEVVLLRGKTADNSGLRFSRKLAVSRIAWSPNGRTLCAVVGAPPGELKCMGEKKLDFYAEERNESFGDVQFVAGRIVLGAASMLRVLDTPSARTNIADIEAMTGLALTEDESMVVAREGQNALSRRELEARIKGLETQSK